MDQVEHVLALIKEFSDAELDALRQKLDLMKPIQTAKTEIGVAINASYAVRRSTILRKHHWLVFILRKK